MKAIKELKFNDKRILLVDGSDRNILCQDDAGNTLWAVQSLSDYLKEKNPAVTDDDIEMSMPIRSFTSIWENEGMLLAHIFSGATCVLDVDTGLITAFEWEE